MVFDVAVADYLVGADNFLGDHYHDGGGEDAFFEFDVVLCQNVEVIWEEVALFLWGDWAAS